MCAHTHTRPGVRCWVKDAPRLHQAPEGAPRRATELARCCLTGLANLLVRQEVKPARTRAAPGHGADTSTAGGLRGAGAAAPPARWREALIPARPRRLDPACSAPPLLPAGCSSSLSSTITCDTSKRERTRCPGTADAAGLQGAGVRMPAAGTAQRAAHLILVVAPSPFAPRRAWTRNGFVVARREVHNRTHPLPLERVCGSLRWLRR